MKVYDNEEGIKKRELVKFLPYLDYYGKQIFPVCFKMNIIGIIIVFVFGLLNFLFYGINSVTSGVFISFMLAAFFILIMALSSVIRFIPDNKRILFIIISGNISVLIFTAANIFIKFRFEHIILTVVFFLYGVIIVAPLLELKVFLIPNLILNIFLFSFLIIKKVNLVDIARIMSFSIISVVFIGFVLKYLKKSFLKLYEAARQNFLFSNLDMLSQLLNRRSWYVKSEECCSYAVKNNEAIAFIMIDVDHFKNINDSYGHSCGDAVIKEVSDVLLNNTRDIDVVGRLGGEEFGILLRITSIDEAMIIAERIRKAIEALQITYSENIIKVTASLGLAFSSKEELEKLMKKGDDCLYKAKNAGRNKIVAG